MHQQEIKRDGLHIKWVKLEISLKDEDNTEEPQILASIITDILDEWLARHKDS